LRRRETGPGIVEIDQDIGGAGQAEKIERHDIVVCGPRNFVEPRFGVEHPRDIVGAERALGLAAEKCLAA
jgi:hypothetical protein